MCLWDILSFGRKWPAFIYTACLKSLALRAFDCTVRCRVMAQFFSRYRTKWNRHILHCLSAGSTGMFTANLTGLYGSHVLVFENQRPAVAISAWGWSKAFYCGSGNICKWPMFTFPPYCLHSEPPFITCHPGKLLPAPGLLLELQIVPLRFCMPTTADTNRSRIERERAAPHSLLKREIKLSN